MAEAFFWGPGGQVISATDVASNRKVAAALKNRIQNPKTFWEGIQSAVGDIGGGLLEWEADETEKRGRQEFASSLAAAQESGNPNDYVTLLANSEFASPSQSAVASALLQRAQAAEDRRIEWGRQDTLRASDRAWEEGLLDRKRAWQLEDTQSERDYNAPVRDLQIESGTEELNQLKEGYRQLVTPEDRAAAGIRPDDLGMYQMGPNGAVEPVGGKGGQTINVNTATGADGELDKALSKSEGESWATFKDAAAVAGSNAQDFAVLDELLKIAPQGPVTGRLADMFQGFSSAGDAAKAIVKRIAPTLRVPGSGATSDIEYAGMLQSLAQLTNTPEANRMIMSIMKAKQDINVRRGEIITAYQNKEISVGEARQQMAELNRMSILTPEMKEALIGIGAEPSVGTTSSGLNWSIEP